MTTDLAVPGEPQSALEQFRAAMGGSDTGVIPGLEDVEQSDLTIPVIQIDHKAGKFVDKLTSETFDTLDVVLLGLLKSRIMWPPQTSAPGQKPVPQCRSRNALSGTPGEAFPWKDWSEGKSKGDDLSPEPLMSESLGCATCYFSQWGSDPKTGGPRCTLQYTFPVVRDGDRLSGLLTVQRTGIKPANAYVSAFVRDQLPLFFHRTTLSLQVNQNGSVQYAVPKFVRGEATPADMDVWKKWAADFQQIKASVQGRDFSDSLTTAKVADSTEESPEAPF